MEIDVILSPSCHSGEQAAGRVAVVIDVLRATSTIVTALGNQALGIIPVLDPGEASGLKRETRYEDCLLGGERRGYKIPGFDLGNSPGEYGPSRVAGKRIILSTTNGTKAIRWAAGARVVLAASFLNIRETVRFLHQTCRDLLLVCSGSHGDLSLEDLTCAGMITDLLTEGLVHPCATIRLSDKARIARYTYLKAQETGLEDFIAGTEHGRYLERIGMGEDLRSCSAVDRYPVLAQLVGNEIRDVELV
ncbi:MAG TPA: 2-phosphosulfolactate phosphatase [Bacillota bacterium]